jgi:hypothetical protein
VNPDLFFNSAWEASRRALEKTGPAAERCFRIAGLPVRLEFAGGAMQESVLPAFRHLPEEAPVQEPVFSVTVWDGASADLPMPFPADVWNDCTAWGEVKSLRGTHVHASRLMDAGVYSAANLRTRQAVYWTNSSDLVPDYARAAPLRSILHNWMRSQRRIFLHGAAVACRAECVLFIGKGGSGKSTTALSCAYAGWQYLGDDYCLASLQEGPCVHSLYCSAKLTPEQSDRFSRWQATKDALRDGQSGKTILFLAADSGVSLIPDANLRAIVMPVITGSTRTDIVPESPLAMWKALAPSTVLQLPGANQEDLTLMKSLVESVPGFRLNLGTDFDDIPDIIGKGVGLI